MKSYNHTISMEVKLMQNKTEILCNVHSCAFHKENHCTAECISVGCDDCIMPNDCKETKCASFRCNCGK